MIHAIAAMFGGDQQTKSSLREVARILERENARLRAENELYRRFVESLREVNASLDAGIQNHEVADR